MAQTVLSNVIKFWGDLTGVHMCNTWSSQEGAELGETVAVSMIQLIYGCLQYFRIWH